MRSHEVIGQDWILRSELWHGEDCDHEWQLMGHRGLEEYARGFEGPLIVKLYGSPLTKIHSKRVLGPDERRLAYDFHHRLVVAEHDPLKRHGSERRSWPRGLRSLLYHPRRVLCAVGYSMGDSEHRLQLFELLEGMRDLRASTSVFMIDDHQEPPDHDFLRWPEVRPVAMSIEEFVRMTERVTDPLGPPTGSMSPDRAS